MLVIISYYYYEGLFFSFTFCFESGLSQHVTCTGIPVPVFIWTNFHLIKRLKVKQNVRQTLFCLCAHQWKNMKMVIVVKWTPCFLLLDFRAVYLGVTGSATGDDIQNGCSQVSLVVKHAFADSEYVTVFWMQIASGWHILGFGYFCS